MQQGHHATSRGLAYDPALSGIRPRVGTRAGVVKKATRNAATHLCCSPKAGMVLTEPKLADRPAMTSWLEGVLQLQDMANVNQNCILAPALCVRDQLRCQFGRKWKRKFYTLAAPPTQGNQRSGTKWIA